MQAYQIKDCGPRASRLDMDSGNALRAHMLANGCKPMQRDCAGRTELGTRYRWGWEAPDGSFVWCDFAAAAAS